MSKQKLCPGEDYADDRITIWNDNNECVAEFNKCVDGAHLIRDQMLACYNACADIPDPAAELARLRAVEKQWHDETRARMDTAKHAATLDGSQPAAWIVHCPPGHEFDSLVFPDKQEAELQAQEFNDDLPEGQNDYHAVPLYPATYEQSLMAENARLRAELAALSPPQPVADWRERCVVEECKDRGFEVVNEAGTHWLNLDEWIAYHPDHAPRGEIGVFPTKARALKALAACPTPPPGAAQ